MSRLVQAVVRCTECGTAYSFQRRRGRQRAAGHVKHVYCVTCRKVTAHKEERDG